MESAQKRPFARWPRGRVRLTLRIEARPRDRPKGEYPQTGMRYSWVAGPAMKIVSELEASLKKYPPIPPGTPDPYTPPQ